MTPSKDNDDIRVDIKNALLGHLPGDEPLAQALGIDLRAIKSESMLPIRVFQNSGHIASASTDLTGPIVILFIFAFSLALKGKFHLSYIYLISITSSSFIYTLLNLLTQKHIRFMICCNVMGYALTPIAVFSLANILLGWMNMTVKILFGLLISGWSAYTASVVFCNHIDTKDKMIAIGYPLLLVYICFIMMSLF